MFVPRVLFTDMPLAQEIDWMHGFLFQNKWGWGRSILKKHPKIQRVLSLRTEAEQVAFLRKYTIEFRRANRPKIERNGRRYEREWRKIEPIFFPLLAEILQCEWPRTRGTIRAKASINPICPRILSDWSFSFYYNYKKAFHAMEVIMHETCHFLYFEKWKKLFPNMEHRRFESPHQEWHLSEIVAPVILNDARVQKLLKQKAVFYREHAKMRIGGESAPDYFTRLYNKTISRDGAESFLREAYQVVKKRRGFNR